MSKYKVHILIGLSCLFIGRYVISNTKVVTKEVIKYVEKKETSATKKERKRVRTIVTTNPNGTTVTETSSDESSDTSTSSSSSTSLDQTTITSKGPTMSLGVLAIKDAQNFSKKTEFGIVASVPLIGNISAISMLDTTKRVGLGLSLEF